MSTQDVIVASVRVGRLQGTGKRFTWVLKLACEHIVLRDKYMQVGLLEPPPKSVKCELCEREESI